MESDLKSLEFDGIRRLLEKLAATPYGAEACRNLAPAPSRDGARRMQAAVSAARAAIEAGDGPPLPELPDVRPALRQARTPGAALAVTALENLRTLLGACSDLNDFLGRHPELHPSGAGNLDLPGPLVARLDEVLSSTGKLREDASEELGRLHGERRSLGEEATEAVRKRQDKRDLRDAVDDPKKVTWHGPRAAITLRATHADGVKGVRRGTAMGGRDVIIEPVEAVAVNNRLEAMDGRIQAEEQRLLREVTDTVREHADTLDRLVTAITWVDLATAGAQLSIHLNAHAPILAEQPGLRLDEAYHPLLLLQFAEGTGPQPVPLTIELDDTNRMLVITGPNTGGKTVVLKTLGLLVTMAHCGLHVPAEGECTIGAYDRVLVDVGDPQDLFHHLSTFAGHVEKLKRILDEADSSTLVLMDELGTGTDPEEGAALAMSVLDELSGRGVQGIVNTHLSPLKDYAESAEYVVNASMRFDHDALAPTYQLAVGEPGRSLGLLIAERNGLAPELVGRARDHLQRIARRPADAG